MNVSIDHPKKVNVLRYEHSGNKLMNFEMP